MPRATIFDEHASVLAHWWDAGVRGATAICLDAHLDLQFIDPDRLRQLHQCTSGQALGKLESRHPLHPDRSACFGIEDFLLPAVRLGVLRRVVWVAPPHVLRWGLAGALAGLQQMEGVDIGQLESFRIVAGGWIEGELLGVPLAIGTLEQLRGLPLDGPVVVDVDADYFVVVPGDFAWAWPAEVVPALKQWLGDDLDLTVARSVGTGFMPLQFGVLADEMAARWDGRQPPEQGAQADHLLRRLGEFRARQRTLDLDGLMALQGEAELLPPQDPAAGPAWVALGLLHAKFGHLASAIDCDQRSRACAGGHPELALHIACLLLAAHEHAAAIPWLERAANDDETRVQAWLHLADVALLQRSFGAAAEWAGRAHEAAPAWRSPVQRLADAAHAAGDLTGAARWRGEQQQLVRRLEAVAVRLGPG
jgi:hypothetical protein